MSDRKDKERKIGHIVVNLPYELGEQLSQLARLYRTDRAMIVKEALYRRFGIYTPYTLTPPRTKFRPRLK